MSSVTCTVFVADDEGAKSMPDGDPQHCYSAEAFTSMSLAELWAMMQGCHYNSDLQDQFVVLLEENDGELVVERFPADFVNRLAELDPEHRRTVLDKWSKTDENSALSSGEVEEMLDEMVKLAKEAKQQKKHVYICNEC